MARDEYYEGPSKKVIDTIRAQKELTQLGITLQEGEDPIVKLALVQQSIEEARLTYLASLDAEPEKNIHAWTWMPKGKNAI